MSPAVRAAIATGSTRRNAIRVAPRGTAVAIRTARRGDRVPIEVEDRGPGLPAAERERLAATSAGPPAAPEGRVGLGLSIARRIVEAHGGAIDAEDRPGAAPGWSPSSPPPGPARSSATSGRRASRRAGRATIICRSIRGTRTASSPLAVSAGTISSIRGYRWAPAIRGGGLAAAAATGYLRIAADKHDLSDVLVGAAVGSAVGFLVPWLHSKVDLGDEMDLAAAPIDGGGVVLVRWGVEL